MKPRSPLLFCLWLWAAAAGAEPNTGSPTAGAGRAEAPAVAPLNPPNGAAAGAMVAIQTNPRDRDAARVAWARAASEGSAPTVASQASFRLGALDEEDGRYASALAHYRACVDAAPFSRWARTANSRISWLTQRSELDFGPLVALQRVRSQPALLHDARAIAQFATESESFPPGLVRSEARTLVAGVWLALAARHGDALTELRKIMSDPSSRAADARFAERDLVDALLADKDLEAAALTVRSYHFDPASEAKVQRLSRRRLVRRAAVAELLAVVGLMSAMIIRRRVLPKSDAGRDARIRARMFAPTTIAAIIVFGGLSVLAACFVCADVTESRTLKYFGV